MTYFVVVCVCAGYVGSPKGAKQMLWERGLWRTGLTLPCCKKILKELPDFKLETSELSNLWRDRGQGFELGVKCHPEMAGCGIEYCWGKVNTHTHTHARARIDCETSVFQSQCIDIL